MTKKILINQAPDFFLIGILSNLKPTKIAWLLNNLKFSFTEFNSANNDSRFSFFIHQSEVEKIILIENKCANEFFVPQIKQFNYLLLSNQSEDIANYTLDKLKTEKEFISTFIIPENNLTKNSLNKIIALLGE